MRQRDARLSPVADRLQLAGARFEQRNAMAVAVSFGEQERLRADSAGLADLGFLHKTGFKGPNAVDWLQQRIGAVPPANGWSHASDGSTVARLGGSEFFIEDAQQATLCWQLAEALRHPVDGVYPVRRNDAGFALIGNRINELLVQVCSFNFRQQSDGGVVMTSMAGVNVLVLRQHCGPRPYYRIWCDPTLAAYLWDTLGEIALELGGGPVGVDMVLSANPSV
jgi:sarcosine oxidase subunit gamma